MFCCDESHFAVQPYHMGSSRKYGVPLLKLYKEEFLGYLTLKTLQTKLKYIFFSILT